MIVSLDQLQSDLPLFISRVQAGEILDIEQAGEVVGRLIPVQLGRRTLGLLEGRGIVPDDIKMPYREEIEAMFYGK